MIQLIIRTHIHIQVHFKADMQAGNCYVAEFTNDVDGASKVCGVIALTEDQGNDYKQLWDISETCIVPHRLCVDPTVRGKGIAKRLMDQAEAVAKERGYVEMCPQTNLLVICELNRDRSRGKGRKVLVPHVHKFFFFLSYSSIRLLFLLVFVPGLYQEIANLHLILHQISF